jgi:hypothetical protein
VGVAAWRDSSYSPTAQVSGPRRAGGTTVWHSTGAVQGVLVRQKDLAQGLAVGDKRIPQNAGQVLSTAERTLCLLTGGSR